MSFFANILPPAFVFILFGTVWYGYVFLHLIPMAYPGDSASVEDHKGAPHRGWTEVIVSQSLTLMWLVCYARALCTHPGNVPTNAEWKEGIQADGAPLLTSETKLTGGRRHCKWCKAYKPDRCHHCRICKSCVLKMDHHCPWIMNCVGYRNHKFFFLLVIYSFAVCLFIAITILESVYRSTVIETPSMTRFMLVLAQVFAMILAFMTGMFLTFHLWLMCKGLTTIEFCEKNMSEVQRVTGKSSRSHDQGLWFNFKVVFGANPLLWLLPIQTLTGDGVHFNMDKNGECPSSEGDGGTDPEWTGEVSRRPSTEKIVKA